MKLSGKGMRKAVALAATPGLIASFYIFIASFFGFTVDELWPKPILLHLGIFALAIPLIFVERWSSAAGPLHRKPKWVLRSLQSLFLLFIFVFLTFLVSSHGAAPDIVNGEYVLNNHGKIVAYISQREYFFLKGWELRLFASGWIVAYYALILFWWFPRQDEWAVVMPDRRS
jgi:hypothetical protein